MFRALLRRDAAYEGVFYAGVKTTGIFCRPTCHAKKPRAENVEFFASVAEALHGGYRPCRLCRPLDRVPAPPTVVERLLQVVEADPATRLTDKDLAGLGIDPSTARRQFRACYGLTFQAYQRARRMGLALHEVREGKPVIDVQLDGGYASTSGFRGAFRRVFGKPPRGARADDCLLARRIDTPLGKMLALADRQGLRLLEFVDRRGLENEIGRLRRRLRCAVVPGSNATLEATGVQLRHYFAGEQLEFNLPLAPVGSMFQQAVWAELGRIPAGATRSYAAVAAAVGRPGAQRAVGTANGCNSISIVIPCHRVIGADGSLSGYGGGVWRKQRLLDHERAVTSVKR
jgi:AraC family transcriptional regulator, regulatory protein of adaptative response / methylated-DNA-[protein]-cysteine methyltransferase